MFLLDLKQMDLTSDGMYSSVLHFGPYDNKEDSFSCVIDDRVLVKKYYTAQHLYALNECRYAISDFQSQSRIDHVKRM